MGYGMAVNLRSKMDRSHTLYICDISDEVIDRFKSELDGQGPIEVVTTGSEAVQKAVSINAVLSLSIADSDIKERTLCSPCYRTAPR